MSNTGLMSLRSLAGGAVLSALLTGGASAVPFAEVGDAGQLVGTAQSVSGGASSISGTISSSTDADLYRFGHPGGAFGATTVAQPGSLSDSQLFLFDTAGNGIVANDDSVGVRAALSLASLAAGTYLLGISSFNVDPSDGANIIFPNTFTGQQVPFAGRGPLASWTGTGGTGTYSIELRQATVPLPGTLALIGIATAAGLFFRRRLPVATPRSARG